MAGTFAEPLHVVGDQQRRPPRRTHGDEVSIALAVALSVRPDNGAV
jgi:hypothetical protein